MVDNELFTKALSLEKPRYVKEVSLIHPGKGSTYRKDFKILTMSYMRKTMRELRFL